MVAIIIHKASELDGGKTITSHSVRLMLLNFGFILCNNGVVRHKYIYNEARLEYVLGLPIRARKNCFSTGSASSCHFFGLKFLLDYKAVTAIFYNNKVNVATLFDSALSESLSQDFVQKSGSGYLTKFRILIGF